MEMRKDLEHEFEELKKKATPTNAFKFVAGTLISIGATAATMAFIKSPLKDAKGIMKLLMKLGIFVIGCKVGDIAEKYFQETVDETIKSFKETEEELKKDESNNNRK